MEKPLRELLTERMKSGDPFLNYCHWPYDPPASGSGKLHPSVLLYKAVNELPHSAWVTKSLQAIQRGIGDLLSVYGIKRTRDTIYFSGVNIDQLLFFLNWQQYPDDYIRFVE